MNVVYRCNTCKHFNGFDRVGGNTEETLGYCGIKDYKLHMSYDTCELWSMCSCKGVDCSATNKDVL